MIPPRDCEEIERNSPESDTSVISVQGIDREQTQQVGWCGNLVEMEMIQSSEFSIEEQRREAGKEEER
jgi:hypothetical protein